jgi:hypothetical protein
MNLWVHIVRSSIVVYADSEKRKFLDEFAQINPTGSRAIYSTISEEFDSMSEISRDKFDTIIRRGIPTVFRDAGSDFKELLSLSCDDFSKRWPRTPMRAEYTGADHEVMVELGEGDLWINNTRAPLGMNLPEDCDTAESQNSRPSVGPYVLHIKDRVRRSLKKEISDMFPGLRWARGFPQTLLDAHTRDSIEFWFQPVGGGTFAHNDGYCRSVMSVQLRGKKKWSFMMIPEVQVLSRDIFNEFDSGIYDSNHKWIPDFEVTLGEGDAVYFPPGYMHETRTIEGPSETDQCATSMTFTVSIPMPTRYIRRFLNRLSTSPEVSHCMETWESYVTLNSTLVDWDIPVESSEQPQLIAQSIISTVDTNGDFRITIDELERYFLAEIKSENIINFYSPKKRSARTGDMTPLFDPHFQLTDTMIQEGLRVRAKDTFEMWDVDEDGIATIDEIRNVLEYFQYYTYRSKLVQSAMMNGEQHFEFGSEILKKRLDLVDAILGKLRPVPPKIQQQPTRISKDEL